MQTQGIVIYSDEKRTLIVQNGLLRVEGRRDIPAVFLSRSLTTPVTEPSYADSLRKEGLDPADRFLVRDSDGQRCVRLCLPNSARAAVDQAIRDYQAEIKAAREDPGNIERGRIEDLRARAEGLVDADYGQSVGLLAQARRAHEQWCIDYPKHAREERIRNLRAKADHQRSLASGALIYDADGSLSADMQEARAAQFRTKAAEYDKQADDLAATL